MTGPEPWQGGRKWVFPVCPWNPEHRNGAAFIVQHANGALAAGCHHNGCAGKNWQSLRALVEGRAARTYSGPDGLYLIDDGRMWKRIFARGKSGERIEVERKIIADFAVRIVEESHTEDGRAWFTLAGETAGGTPMHCNLPVEEFTAERGLLAALTTAAGARWGVHLGMTSCLRPAIQALSGPDLAFTTCYERTGWAETGDGLRFLMPGREIAGVQVRLRKLPYCIPPGEADARRLARAVAGFRSLLRALEPERTTVIATLPFQAPLARPAGWSGDRYAIFIAGRTGSLKTSFSQALMCLYGAGFAEDQHLLKLGEGATRNALLFFAEQAHDMPLLVDNYKPNTGDGARGLINLLHNLIEGAGRERLNKESQLKEARPIACWPLLTGEDAPRGDAAALARLLVAPVRWPSTRDQTAGHNEPLAQAQAAAADFPLLGAAWLDWLESAAGQAAARRAGEQFAARRATWAGRVGSRANVGAGARPSRAMNVLRLATNLATNELTWAVLCQHPVLGGVAREFEAAHAAGLELLAVEMAQQTAENVEAVRFVDVLQQLLAAGQHRLVERGEERDGDGKWRDGVIGWHAPDGGAYLLPEIARRAVEGVLGPDGLNRISMETLYAQLDELGYVGERGTGRRTKMVRPSSGKTVRVLHLTGAALGEGVADENL